MSARRQIRFIARRFEVPLRRSDDVVRGAFDLIEAKMAASTARSDTASRS
jgi:hypothetical protein